MLQKNYSRSVTIWLFTCAALIVVMVAIGGLTRLTGSGLSITSWKPVTGFIPPLNEAQWQQEFAAYKMSPEFRKVNHYYNLAEFKSIFWLEFIHRLVGRITGVVVLLPLLYFLVTRQIDKQLAFRLTGIFLLGGLQGVVGWYMVKSGLKDVPYVSHLWLAGHLLMASVIFALLFISALQTTDLAIDRRPLPKVLRSLIFFLPVAVLVQIGLGGLVAGMDAGLVYNTFPTMDGQMIPEGMLFMQPLVKNFISNATTVQFEHRIGAVVLLLMSITVFVLIRAYRVNSLGLQRSSALLLGVVLIQFALGVCTLLLQVPVPLASAHQMMAMIIFAITLFVYYIA